MAVLRANFNLTTATPAEIFLAVCFPAVLVFILYLLFKQRDRTESSQWKHNFVAAGLGVSMVIAGVSVLVPLVQVAMK